MPILWVELEIWRMDAEQELRRKKRRPAVKARPLRSEARKRVPLSASGAGVGEESGDEADQTE